MGLLAGKDNDTGIGQILSIEEKYLLKKTIFMPFYIFTLLELLVTT